MADPRATDTDHDGVTDGLEVGAGLAPLAPDGYGAIRADPDYSSDLVVPDDIDGELVDLHTTGSLDDTDAYTADPPQAPDEEFDDSDLVKDAAARTDLDAFGQGDTDTDDVASAGPELETEHGSLGDESTEYSRPAHRPCRARGRRVRAVHAR